MRFRGENIDKKGGSLSALPLAIYNSKCFFCSQEVKCIFVVNNSITKPKETG